MGDGFASRLVGFKTRPPTGSESRLELKFVVPGRSIEPGEVLQSRNRRVAKRAAEGLTQAVSSLGGSATPSQSATVIGFLFFETAESRTVGVPT